MRMERTSNISFSKDTIINLIFSCALIVWMITPYLNRNISPALLIFIFIGWLISALFLIRSTGIMKSSLYPIIWFAYILSYKLLGISTSSWGNYFMQFFFWFSYFMGILILNYYREREKKFVILFIWLVTIVNIIDNIRLLSLYPGASVAIYQSWGTQYLQMNVGVTNFSILAVIFFCFNLMILKKYKTYKIAGLLGCAVSLIYIYMSSRGSTYIVLGLILIAWLSIDMSVKRRNGEKPTINILFIVLIVILFILFPVFVDVISKKFPHSAAILRLMEISNIFYGESYDTVTSGATRIQDAMLSISTWLSSIKSFFFGVGFHGTDATSVSIQNSGIGQHSEMIDCLARYGLVGTFLLLRALLSTFKRALDGMKNKAYYWWVYFAMLLYTFLNSFMGSTGLAVLLFMMLPIAEQIAREKEIVSL